MKWQQQSLKLKKNHGWRTKPGNKIFIADRGAVRFDYPASWVVVPGDDSIRLYDKPPPDDDVLLQVSLIRLAAGIDWSFAPLVPFLLDLTQHDERGLTQQGDVIRLGRPDIEAAWLQALFVDPNEARQACSRTLLARQSNLQTLITLDFWPEDRARVEPVWQELLRSLRMGEYIRDPTRGF